MKRLSTIVALALAASATAQEPQHAPEHAAPAEHSTPPPHTAPPAHGPPPGNAAPPARLPPQRWHEGQHDPHGPAGRPIEGWHNGDPARGGHPRPNGDMQHDHRRWNGDMHVDHRRWNGGHWWHGNVGGRRGWWWIVGPEWYWYPAPIYPDPDPNTPPGLEPGYWYWCEDYQDYYPNVADCPSGWQQEEPTD
jgi:hypothetical protein